MRNIADNNSDRTSLLRNPRGGHDIRKLKLDHLAPTPVQVVSKKQQRRSIDKHMSWFDFSISYTSMLCSYYPRTCCVFSTSTLLIIMLFLANFIFNPIQELGVLVDEHFDIKSKYDMSISQVDHWCLRGGDEGCRCEDPLQPIGRMDHLSWVQAIKDNRRILEDIGKSSVDIAILGESVVEAMGGRWMGKTRTKMQTLGRLFNHTMEKNSISAVALGVAGDAAPNVLWRILHGEMPDSFQPKIWWLSLGMNDLARMECSEEIVVLGILRVVEEIMFQRPKAHIVINSVLPMAHVRGGAYPILSDYSEAFIEADDRSELDDEESGDRRQLGDLLDRAEEIEQKRDKNLRKKKQIGPTNAVLSARNRVRKYQIGGSQFRPVPLWTSIRAINRQLRKFSTKPENNRVHFYDATELFVDKTHRQDRIRGGLITLAGYPRPRGFQLWENNIIEMSKGILEDMRRTNPELFSHTELQSSVSTDDLELDDDPTGDFKLGGLGGDDFDDFDSFSRDSDGGP